MEFDIYYPMYVQARLCEREAKVMRLWKSTWIYYVHTFQVELSITKGRYHSGACWEYDNAIRICDMAIMRIQAGLFNADTEDSEKRKARLIRKRAKQKTQDR